MIEPLSVQISNYISYFRGTSLQARFVTAAFWSLAGAVFARGLTLVASVVVARLLGSTAFGELGIIQSTLGLLGVFAGAGLGLTTTKYVAEYRTTNLAKAGRCVAISIRTAIIAGITIGAVLLILSDWIASSVLDAPHLVGALRVAVGIVIFGAINGVQGGAFAGLEAFRTVALLNSLRAGVLLGGMVVGVYLAGVMGAVLGLVVAEAVSVFANQLALQRHLPRLLVPIRYSDVNWGEIGILWRFSLLALLSSLFTMPALWLSNFILVSQPQGYAALGIFNAADRWRQVLLFFPSSLSTIVLSMLSNLHGVNDAGSYRKIFSANLWINVSAVLIPTFGLIIFAPLAMAVFGTEYQRGWVALIILAVSAVFYVLNNVLGQVLVSRGLIGWRCGLDALQALVLVLCSWWFIPTYKENGLALAHLIAFVATVFALMMPVRHYLRKQS